MKRFWMLCCCVLLSLALLLSACSPAASFIEADTPSFPGLTWGMSKEEAFEALGVTEEDSTERDSSQFEPYISTVSYLISGYKILGETVDVLLVFPSPEWTEKNQLSLGLLYVTVACDLKTAEKMESQLNESTYEPKTGQLGQSWGGPNAYQTFCDQNIWDEMGALIIKIFALEEVDPSVFHGAKTPEEIAEYAAKENNLSTVSSIDFTTFAGDSSQEGSLEADVSFYYNGLYAAVLALAEKQQTAE